jgi:GNAT superfamily N-acetyltransferase
MTSLASGLDSQSARPHVAIPLTVCKGYRPGAIGRIVLLHARYYHKHAGFGLPFERKVTNELSEFCARYVDERDGLWLALREGGGEIEGSIAIDGAHAERDGAHLRWFICSDEARGTGIGTVLIDSAMAFCRSRNYDHVHLWTFEGLAAARHLYETVGFWLAQERRGTQWGAEVNEQRFEWRS